ncbi:MAG: aromatic ring-hydroxylating dioxygenase subunit alpha [Myxococcota bacterium]
MTMTIPNHWYPILQTRQLRKRPVAIHRLGQRLVVFRGLDGQPRALLDRCPHRGVALSLGRVQGNTLECRYHGLRFDGQGQCTHLPCEGAGARIPRGLEVSAFDLREAHGLVWLWWGAKGDEASRPEIPWFHELPTSTHYTSDIAKVWPVDVIRAGEAMFDTYHAPFVHRGYIPRVGTRVGPVEVDVDGDQIEMRGSLLPQPGSKERSMRFRTRFMPPTLSLLDLGDGQPLWVADCPIDEDSTWRLARQYTDPKIKGLGLGRLLAWLHMLFGWYVIQELQDRPVVRTQSRFAFEAGDEKLLRPDAGLLRYRQVQRRMLERALQDERPLPPLVHKGLQAAARGLGSSPSVAAAQ